MAPSLGQPEEIRDQKKCGINTPSFSLIFVNYRSSALLEQALKSFQEKETGSARAELWVVNNDARETEALRALRQEFSFTLIENEENRGFGPGANQAAREAHGNILGFLNPDILWQESILEKIEEIFARTPRLGILGLGLITVGGQPEAWSGGKEVTVGELLKNNLWLRTRSNSGKGLQRRDWVSGGALFIRRELFERLRGFDERYFLYFEDVDLCRRAREAGSVVAWAPELTVTHLGGRSALSRKTQKKAFYRSQDYYLRQHASRPAYLFFRVLRFVRYGF